MNKILVSFSGGRTSAFMAKLIQEHPTYKDYQKLFVYANTGKEAEATLQFIDKCDKEFNLNLVWVEADVVHEKQKGTQYTITNFKDAKRKGEPFTEVVKKYGLPSKLYRHCTRELKEIPIGKYAKDILGKDYVTAIGIRADEKHRLGNDPKKVYPLAELGIDEQMVRNFWDRQTFDLELKDYQGNCDLCFLKSVRKKLTIIKENPKTADWWLDLEVNNIEEGRPMLDVYRNLSMDDLINMAKNPFRKAVDQHELRKQQSNLFDIDMDLEFDCFCKMN
jgi:hypothetical protein